MWEYIKGRKGYEMDSIYDGGTGGCISSSKKVILATVLQDNIILKIMSNVLWWLILCGNLTGLKDAQITGKTLFFSVRQGISGRD